MSTAIAKWISSLTQHWHSRPCVKIVVPYFATNRQMSWNVLLFSINNSCWKLQHLIWYIQRHCRPSCPRMHDCRWTSLSVELFEHILLRQVCAQFYKCNVGHFRRSERVKGILQDEKEEIYGMYVFTHINISDKLLEGTMSAITCDHPARHKLVIRDTAHSKLLAIEAKPNK